jgi:hypothetical protein
MKKLKQFYKSIVVTSLLLVVVFGNSVYAVPTAPSDVKFFVDGMNLVGFAGLVVSALITGTAGVRWAILRFKMSHEDDPGKLSEYESLIKKSVTNSVLGLGASIVTAVLAFFV